MRALQRIILEENNLFRIIGEAEDGQEAIRLAGTLQPDIVLLDLAMPVMGGLEALPHIRRVAPGAKVIVVTMLQREGTEAEAIRLGATAYLDKGLDSVEFVTRLETSLRQAPAAGRRKAFWGRATPAA